MSAALLDFVQTWTCPDCHAEWRSPRPVANRWHHCRSRGGMAVPMVPDGLHAKIEVVKREDYVGGQSGIRWDNLGRPIAGIHTVSDNQQDAVAFAPRAVASARCE
jgi:hypothetical protein